MNTSDSTREDIMFDVTLRDIPLRFHTTWGLFSPKRIDEGSEMLLDEVVVKPTDICFDLGCGYGAIGIPLAKMASLGKVHMVDKDFVAVEYARKNTAINQIRNCDIYLSNAFSRVPDIKFDIIASNLPAKVGGELLSIILTDAKTHLKEGGSIYLVTISGLRDYIKRNVSEVFGNYEKLKQGKTYTVCRAVKTR